ncbi:MAG: NAD(P)/FAD-dependent oxidoreductase [Parachlamydiaceae bacterium]|nr:NAD(P)/FAD-dependent oxidoreductase [Parachlamydiaceae bacterium]
MSKTFVVVGGGAAGFFGAIAAKNENPACNVLLLEKSAVLLSKVRVSGGGRCNVTHACFDPMKLTQNYPRGDKALIGPFHRFQPRDTVQWFESRGVMLKTENDGRMFPVTDDSQTIIDCLLLEAQRLGVSIRLKQRIERIVKQDKGFELHFAGGETLFCDGLLLATGSSPQGHQWAQELGHSVKSSVPSLFTFNVPTSPLLDLSGITLPLVGMQLVGTTLKQQGPLLLTHWGFSGPAALKLSAWGARWLHEQNYRVQVCVDWLPQLTQEAILQQLRTLREWHPIRSLLAENPFGLPKNLWKRFLEMRGLVEKKRMSDVSNAEFIKLAEQLHGDIYQVEGRTTNKEEFVTCGGVELKEVDFRTMESRVCPGLYFAGEILDVDAVTGGFNFQNAWTTGLIAGESMAEK